MFTFLFDNNSAAQCALLFERPLSIVRADEPAEVDGALAELSRAQKKGLYAAGFLSFELGLLFEPKLARRLPPDRKVPLLMFGVFERPNNLSNAEVERWLEARGTSYSLKDIQPNLQQGAYNERFGRILDYIGAGDIYQLNLTFKAKFGFEGSRAALYRELRRKQRVAHGAFVETDNFSLLSLSPELFIEADEKRILTRPMKGTAPRGFTAAEDEERKAWLESDIKSRAENLMIVDLMRNDLSRIAKPGSVRVPDLFTVETFETVLQMTSGVEGALSPDCDFSRIIRALFPPGSVTGAPKLRAVEIIRELESEPRGVYTGAIGFLSPHGGCHFNVAIRTLYIGRDGKGEAGIGSGIVQDSRARSEYEECLLKLKFLTDPPAEEFELIETLRFDWSSGYILLQRHLDRLEQSASRLGFRCPRAEIVCALYEHAARLSGPSHRVRMTLSREGRISIGSTALPPPPPRGFTFAIAPNRVDPSNLFLYHKTTNRRMYDDTRKALNAVTGCDEVLFLNTLGELTEGSFTNLFLEINGEMLTPAVSCGLLSGTLRQDLIEQGQVREAVLTLDDLARASGVWLGNSVRGLVRARQIEAAEAEQTTAT